LAIVLIASRFPAAEATLALVTLHLGTTGGHAVSAQAPVDAPRTSQAIYRSACAACHGVDGRGTPQNTVGFDVPVPDFTDCNFATREPDADWFAIAHQGGPVRAFDRRMPAFGEVLTGDEIGGALEHIRGFCQDTAWPRGELNIPRPLVTEKAYPEDEAVLTTTVSTRGGGAVTNQFLYERRIGARSQYEVAVPVAFAESTSGSWERGLGDIAVAFKHTVWHSQAAGGIFSVAGEVVLPTGKESRGLGKGATIVEPFAAFGQLLPAGGFLHAQAGAEER
jgi:mono/diheme cytochrome c family protein